MKPNKEDLKATSGDLLDLARDEWNRDAARRRFQSINARRANKRAIMRMTSGTLGRKR